MDRYQEILAGETLVVIHPIKDGEDFIDSFNTVKASRNSLFVEDTVTIEGRVVSQLIVPKSYLCKPDRLVKHYVSDEEFENYHHSKKSAVVLKSDSDAKVSYSTVAIIRPDEEFVLRRITGIYTEQEGLSNDYILACLEPLF